MSEVRRIFSTLVDQRGVVSVSYISTHLEIDRRRVFKIVEMFERGGYVNVQPLERVVLVVLTPLGLEKADAWRKGQQKRPRPKRVPAALKVAGGIFLALVICFAWWWLDLFPQSGGPPIAGSAPLLDTLPAPTETVVPRDIDTVVALPTDTATSTLPVVQQPTPTVAETQTPDGPGPLPTPIPIGTPAPSKYWAIPTPVPLQEQVEAVNIVLMGTDSTSGSWRTDTLIIVSVDPSLPSVSMLSIPRDLYVFIPGWKMSRINAADFHGERVGYPGGGPGLVKATIEYNLGIRVHYFARVDFQGFINILDTLGGVDLVVDCDLRDTFPDPDAVGGSSDITLSPGVHHLNGKQALWYTRSRWNTSDFDRGRRQQRVLRGTLSKIKQLELLPKLPELWDDLIQTVQTDLSLETALWLAGVATRLNTQTAIKSRFIDNTVVQNWRSPDGAAVLLPLYDRIGPLVAEALAPPDTARSRQGVAGVEVLNGTSWPDWAVLAADRLLWEGFKVVSIGQADRTDYQRTTIINAGETKKGSPVNHLARILRVNEGNVVPAETSNDPPDFRVIVGYDYRPCYLTYWRALHAPTPTPTQ